MQDWWVRRFHRTNRGVSMKLWIQSPSFHEVSWHFASASIHHDLFPHELYHRRRLICPELSELKRSRSRYTSVWVLVRIKMMTGEFFFCASDLWMVPFISLHSPNAFFFFPLIPIAFANNFFFFSHGFLVWLSFLDCNEDALESMGNRLLDWFSVVMADTQKRKLKRRRSNNQGRCWLSLYRLSYFLSG